MRSVEEFSQLIQDVAHQRPETAPRASGSRDASNQRIERDIGNPLVPYPRIDATNIMKMDIQSPYEHQFDTASPQMATPVQQTTHRTTEGAFEAYERQQREEFEELLKEDEYRRRMHRDSQSRSPSLISAAANLAIESALEVYDREQRENLEELHRIDQHRQEMDQKQRPYHFISPILEAYERETEEFAALIEQDQRRQEIIRRPRAPSPISAAATFAIANVFEAHERQQREESAARFAQCQREQEDFEELFRQDLRTRNLPSPPILDDAPPTNDIFFEAHERQRLEDFASLLADSQRRQGIEHQYATLNTLENRTLARHRAEFHALLRGEHVGFGPGSGRPDVPASMVDSGLQENRHPGERVTRFGGGYASLGVAPWRFLEERRPLGGMDVRNFD